MNEVSTLSNDINVITAEINAYQRVAGEAIFEIGKRLKHVKENDLAHGEWERWLTNDAKMSPAQGRMFIKVATEFGENRCTFNELGLRALYEIATMPEEARTETHTIPSTGATKTVDEMTVRELREVKKALREAQETAQQADSARRQAEAQNAQLTQKLAQATKPEIITVEKEVIREIEIDKTDYTVAERLKAYEERFGALENYTDRIRGTNLSDVTTSVITFSKAVRDLAKRHAYLAQYQDTINALDPITKQQYNESIDALRSFTDLFSPRVESANGIIDAIIIEQ